MAETEKALENKRRGAEQGRHLYTASSRRRLLDLPTRRRALVLQRALTPLPLFSSPLPSLRPRRSVDLAEKREGGCHAPGALVCADALVAPLAAVCDRFADGPV